MVRRAGIIVSVIQASDLGWPTRIDAEYYRSDFISLLKKQSASSSDQRTLKELCDKIDVGFVGPMSHAYAEDGIPLLQTQNIKEFLVDYSNVIYINNEFHKQLSKSQLFPGDVLIARSGSIGNAAIVTSKDLQPLNSSDIVILHPNEKLNGFYLCAYINSKFGQAQIERLSSGGVQGHINLGALEKVIIPLLPSKLQSHIEHIITTAQAKRNESKQLYTDAEKLLASELGFKKFELPNEDITTQHISDVIKVKRIDAEFFHPQKAYAKEWLSKFSGNTVGEHFKPIRNIYSPPTQDTGKSILNFDLTHALHYFLDEDGEIIPENEIGSLKKRIQKDDVVVSRLRSYLKEIAIVEVPQNKPAVGSSEFIVLRSLSGKLLPEALLVYLRSLPVQIILKWSQDGSNHPRFQENELLAIKVPDKVLKLQDDIRKMIRTGIKAHQEAKRLLAEAKEEVEKMIEGK